MGIGLDQSVPCIDNSLRMIYVSGLHTMIHDNLLFIITMAIIGKILVLCKNAYVAFDLWLERVWHVTTSENLVMGEPVGVLSMNQ